MACNRPNVPHTLTVSVRTRGGTSLREEGPIAYDMRMLVISDRHPVLA